MEETNTPLNNNNPKPPSTGAPPDKKSRLLFWRTVVIAAALVMAVGAGAAGYYFTTRQPKPAPANLPVNTDNPTTTPTVVTPTTTNETTGQTPPSCKTKIATTRQLSGQIVWSAAKEIDPLDIFSGSSTYTQENTKFYLVGKVASGKYENADVILADVAFEGPYMYPNYLRLLRQGSQIIYLTKYSIAFSEGDGFDQKKISVDKDFSVPDLDYPGTLQSETNRQTFELDKYATGTFCGDNLVKMFTHAVYGDVYSSRVAASETSPQAVPSGYGFYLAAPDGTTKTYKLVVDFVGPDNVPQVTWNDESVNKNEYVYTRRTGCGSADYLAVFAPQEINPDRDLVLAGKNSYGEPVYELKNTDHPLLKDIYDNQYFVYQGQKVSYADFIKNRPVFFWKDPFGRLVRFQNNKFVPPAECAKPVIYLYPQTPKKVSVKLEPRGGFTYTAPAYSEGWRVLAEPSGQLTDLATGRKYPYLFWEGRGGIYKPADKGFVAAKSEVANLLKEKLALLGLNKKETTDFMEFWLPRMQNAPYYFITFYGNRVMDALAPLNIQPKPDTVIRVLMDFKPLERPMSVTGFDIATPARSGFTVVEWGGVLRP